MADYGTTFTYTLTNSSLTISGTMGYSSMAVRLVTGSVSVRGNGSAGSLASQPISISTANSSMEISQSLPFDSVLINSVSGTCLVILAM